MATLAEVDDHKIESPSRIKADSDDRNAIRDKLETCVDPLDVSQGHNLILPNDQEECYYHEGRQEEASIGSIGTVWLRIDICKGDGIDEY